jgi:hypothetical protein
MVKGLPPARQTETERERGGENERKEKEKETADERMGVRQGT